MFEERVERAKELLQTVRHAALATVNADGSPHNSPVFTVWDKDLNFYWASGQKTQHSQNIADDNRVFAVIFDSMGRGGGLYVRAKAYVLKGNELNMALDIVNKRREKPVVGAEYAGEAPQWLYKAVYEQAWVNVTQKTADGKIIHEHRQEVHPSDLF